MQKYLVQYRNQSSEWVDIQAPISNRSRAIEVFMEEAKADSEYPHRVVEVTEQVIANIDGQD